jgi:hypothetical protein
MPQESEAPPLTINDTAIPPVSRLAVLRHGFLQFDRGEKFIRLISFGRDFDSGIIIARDGNCWIAVSFEYWSGRSRDV